MLMPSAPMKRLSSVTAALQRGLAAAESVFALFDLESETDTGSQEIGHARDEIRFDHVSLTYAGKTRPALDNVDLTIPVGQTVALVGGSGGGTYARLHALQFRDDGADPRH